MHTFEELHLTEKNLGGLYCYLKYVAMQLLRFFILARFVTLSELFQPSLLCATHSLKITLCPYNKSFTLLKECHSASLKISSYFSVWFPIWISLLRN